MRTLALAYVLVLQMAAVVAEAQERMVLRAEPEVKVEASSLATERTRLSAAQRQQSAVLIVERSGRYYWATRGDRELLHRLSGVVHLFVDPTDGEW